MTRNDADIPPPHPKVRGESSDHPLIGSTVHGPLAHMDHEDAVGTGLDKRTLTAARLGLHAMPAHEPTLASVAVTVWKTLDFGAVRVRPFPYFMKVTHGIAVEAEGLD